MKLMREVRLFLSDADRHTELLNAWAGTAGEGLVGPFWLLRATVKGQVDPETGYLCSIAELDALLRRQVAPELAAEVGPMPTDTTTIARALRKSLPHAAQQCPTSTQLASLELRLSPFLGAIALPGDPIMVCLTQSFEFSASHRLYCKSLTDEQNKRMFGKCANPNGHGHNYVVDVTITGDPDPRAGTLIELPRFERIVRQHVIDRFDHKHLNLDCQEFESLNPSVENIARVIWQCLEDKLAPASVSEVRVWETPKTCAIYTGPA